MTPLSGQVRKKPIGPPGENACRKAHAHAGRILPATNSLSSDNIDIVSYTINMTADFNAGEISVRCDIGLRSMEQGLNGFSLDFVGLTVSRVQEDLIRDVGFSQSGGELLITPFSPLNLGEERTYSISYQGRPSKGLFFRGENNGICFTFTQPNDSRYWFPCRDVPNDKADWYRGNIVVPSDHLVASNGELEGTQDNGDGTTTFHYFHDYPISTYLISLAISRYGTFTQNSTGGVSMMHYVYPPLVDDAVYDWENVPAMVDFYSNDYFPYPFPTYGMATAPLGGAMEHQTMTTMSSGLITGNRRYESTVAHELAHQWWGDMVTCYDWPNIWLNEGFATYFDALFTEHFYGEEDFRNQMEGNRSTYFSWESYEGRFPLYNPDYMWGGTVYNKGAWVLHMLRNVVGTATFKNIMQEYATRYLYDNARTEDFIEVCEDVAGTDLDWFFDQWVYMAGYPEYQYRWSYQAGTITIRIDQIQEVDSVTPLFNMPVDLRILTPSGDIDATVWVDQESENFFINTPAEPSRVLFDPDVWLLCKVRGMDGLVAAPGPDINNPCLVRTFDVNGDPLGPDIVPYGADRYGACVATGDIDGDSKGEILTGPGPGPVFGPQVRGFELSGTPMPGVNFFAYGTRKWGVNVTAQDINGDGIDEILTGAGPGAVFGPHVRAFAYDGSGIVMPIPEVSFFAYGTRKWGVNVSGGDIDGDGFCEIITGAGPGAVFGPHVRAFNYDGGGAVTPLPAVSFFAYGTRKWGANVSGGDIDGDGFHEIITGAGPGEVFSTHVRAFNYDGMAVTPIDSISFFAFGSFKYGVQVGAADLNGDGAEDLIVAPGPDPAAPARIFTYSYSASGVLDNLLRLTAFEGVVRGARVAGGSLPSVASKD